MKPWVLIPAYEPDDRLFSLAQALCGRYGVVIVDDGSRGEGCSAVFDNCQSAGAVILRHAVNHGKGTAIKTGLTYLRDIEGISGAITADADGQHAPADIDKLALAMEAHPDALVLGVRDFSQMPPRSRAGNTVTRLAFRASTGLNVTDTQTGLRGLPFSLFDELIELAGERYEYEMNMLLALKGWGAEFVEVKIATIYIDNNSSTHFHALRDGIRVFSRVLKYAASSILSAALDYGIYLALLAFGLAPGWSFAIARVISSVLNYELNCRMVFRASSSALNAISYAALVGFGMLVGSPAVNAITNAGVNEVLAKLIIDAALFIFNFVMQKYVIFRIKPKR